LRAGFFSYSTGIIKGNVIPFPVSYWRDIAIARAVLKDVHTLWQSFFDVARYKITISTTWALVMPCQPHFDAFVVKAVFTVWIM
jgi:hypothetical protein